MYSPDDRWQFLCLPVECQSPIDITINSDGTISPASSPIQLTDRTYTLTGDITGTITVCASNIVLDGEGFTLWGGETYHGQVVLVNHVSNVTVRNLFIPAGSGEFGGGYLQIGISLVNSTGVTVENNTISGFDSVQALNGIQFSAISVSGGYSNILIRNKLMDNIEAMFFSLSTNNQVIENNIIGISVGDPLMMYHYGITLADASNNIIYHNNFINNTAGASVYNSINQWDDGYPNGGNYWSDYLRKYPNASMIDKSGIGNTPYFVNELDRDRYPLMKPFDSALYSIQVEPPKVAIISQVTEQQYEDSSVNVTFTVNKDFNWAGYSLDGNPNLTLANSTIIGNLTNGVHTLTIYVNSTFGVIGASETISFTIAKPQPFPILDVALGGAVAAVGVGLFAYFYRRRLAKQT